MFAVSSRWMLERNMLVLKITGMAKLNGISFIDSQIKSEMIRKISYAISEAEKYNGRALDVIPSLPKEEKTLVICCSIIFSSESNLNAFTNECGKILNQG